MTAVSNISVVITCYSEGELLWDAIHSIQQQSFPALEILVVNDASRHPDTVNVCHQLEMQPDVRVIWRQLNGGPSAARNDGFKAAKGEILVPLDGDDVLPEHALAAIHQAFQEHPEAGFIYGAYLRQDRAEGDAIAVHPGDVSLQTMLRSKPFSLSSNWKLIGTTPLRKSLWQSVGGYDTEFGVDDLHDVEFWIRTIATECDYHAISQTIYTWRKYLGSNSRLVTPLAWYRVVKRHFDLYRQLGLEYRAYELLLLGSKWLNQAEDIKNNSQALMRCLRNGQFRSSTLVALAIPAFGLRGLASYARQRR
ncbi:MAG: glycosyltransferase [Trichocoleus desertorum ATA4-8-CV12]|nr:glycosyltransferase [Trichocoleus desertorum ATA4-8-CV12]